MLHRALEKIPRKGKMFDPAESGGHNLLEEMSLLELRQRLAYTQQRLMVRLLLPSPPLLFSSAVSTCYSPFATTPSLGSENCRNSGCMSISCI